MARTSAPPAWPPRTLARIPLGYVPRDPRQILELTEEQREVAHRLAAAHRSLLDGATGSGKTHIAAGVAAGYAQLGQRVLFLSPRKPLAIWLQRAMHPLGVTVMTIGECAKEVLQAAGKPAPVRKKFDDPEYFLAASARVKPGRWDLIVADEWQTASPDEQRFVLVVAGHARFIELRDTSRELRACRISPSDAETRLGLGRCMRSSEPVARLDYAYAHEGIEPVPPPGPAEHVFVTRIGYRRDEPKEALQALVGTLRSQGIAPGEIGVVSAFGQAQSGLLADQLNSWAPTRAARLSEPWALSQLACDSFAYWAGLERRIIVVVEAPAVLPDRRRRLHMAVSRACEEVHFLLPDADVASDEVLSAWLRSAED